MKTNKVELIARCDELTQKGEKLSVKWNGGNNSGFYELLIDDKIINDLSFIDEQIIKLISISLQYGTFAGDFNCEGVVVYDRKTKSFRGKDTYTERENETQNCKIKISIPSSLWFDHLDLLIEAEEMSGPAVTVKLIVINGPLTTLHQTCERKLEEMLGIRMSKEINKLMNFNSMWFEKRLYYNDFSRDAQKSSCILKSFEYDYYDDSVKELDIQLTDKI